MKSRLTFICLNLAAVCALLGMEWYETHGGPVIIPPRDFIFAMLAVLPVMNVLYALVGCRPHRGQV